MSSDELFEHIKATRASRRVSKIVKKKKASKKEKIRDIISKLSPTERKSFLKIFKEEKSV